LWHAYVKVVARSCMVHPVRPTGGPSDRSGGEDHPRAAPVFLVVDTAALALVTLHTLQVSGVPHSSTLNP